MDTMAHIFNPQLRGARKLARARLKESKKLLRRGHKRISADTRKQVEDDAQRLRDALKEGKPNKIHKAADKLGQTVDSNLARFRKPSWRENFESIGFAVLVALILRAFILEAFKIPSGSMIPTLAIGDQIFVNKYVYGMRVPLTSHRIVDFSVPERGDVVVFICPQPPNDDYIKRVIGRAGDEIRVKGGQIYINGEAVSRRSTGRKIFTDRDHSGRWSTFTAETFEETLDDHTYTVLQDVDLMRAAADYGPVIVPPGHLFVMGDNRDHSYDSRAWGFVPLENVLGRSMFVWWSWGRDGLAADRLGTWIE